MAAYSRNGWQFSPESAFGHYHELVNVADGTFHPTKVLWLKHTAVSEFTLDGGPHPEFSHDVNVGLDREFLNNFLMPYTAGSDYRQGLSIDIDGDAYYLAGPVVGQNGETEVPGHEWVQIATNSLVGRHLNSGPGNAPQWWSSDAEDGALLFTVEAVIDAWSAEIAADYIDRGFVHYHELVNAATGDNHPDKVIWLRHAAVAEFNFDGGPMAAFGHIVQPGIDLNFMPNGAMPYGLE